MNRDLLNNAAARRVANAAMSVIDATQRGYQPHEQLLGIAAAFLFVAEHWNIPAQEAFTIIKRIINDQDGKRPEFAAVKAYMENELS